MSCQAARLGSVRHRRAGCDAVGAVRVAAAADGWAVRPVEDEPSELASWGLPILAFAVAMIGRLGGCEPYARLLTPIATERERYVRYRVADLRDRLPEAAITPTTPFCSDPNDPTGCVRVQPWQFVMPENGDTRPVIFAHAPARVTLPLDVPRAPAFLWLSPALDPLAWSWGGDGVTFRVRVVQDGQRHRVVGTPSDACNPADQSWVEAFVPLDAYAGKRVNLVLETDPGPAGNADADRGGWGSPWLMSGTLEATDATP